jgi:polar amino acid transport system substrate-binding protein
MTGPLARRVGLFAVVVAVVLAATACSDIPADPEGTLERATGGVLRVGMSHHEPWTSLDDGERSGVEVELVEEFAADIDADVEWHDGGEESLIDELHRGELDVVVGGLTGKSPWISHAALTRPYVVVTSPTGSPEPHVMATRMGENALLVALEGFLTERAAEIAQQVDGEQP